MCKSDKLEEFQNVSLAKERKQRLISCKKGKHYLRGVSGKKKENPCLHFNICLCFSFLFLFFLSQYWFLFFFHFFPFLYLFNFLLSIVASLLFNIFSSSKKILEPKIQYLFVFNVKQAAELIKKCGSGKGSHHSAKPPQAIYSQEYSLVTIQDI